MENTLINPEHIVTVKVYEKKVNTDWYYISRKKHIVQNFFRRLVGFPPILPDVEYGFRMGYDIDDELFSDRQVLEYENKCYIENNVVYYRPHIEIEYSDRRGSTKYFENVGEMIVFLEINVLPVTNWVKI